MKKKYIIFLMQILTSICMVSVGFASWTFVSGDSIIASGNIKSESVNSFADYIDFDGDIKGFKYCNSCFLNDDLSKSSVTVDGTVYNRGTCTANLLIKLDNCKAKYNNDSLKIEIEFNPGENSTFNLFENATNVSHTIILPEGVTMNEPEVTKEGNYKVTFILENYLKNYDPTIKYVESEPLSVQIHFDLTDAQYANAVEHFSDSNFIFDCDVRLEGVNHA